MPATAYPFGNRVLELDDDDDNGEADEEAMRSESEYRPKEFTIWDCLEVRPKTIESPSKSEEQKDKTKKKNKKKKTSRTTFQHLTLGELITEVEAAAGEGAVLRSLSIASGGGSGSTSGGSGGESGGSSDQPQQRIVYADFPPFNNPKRLTLTVPEAIGSTASNCAPDEGNGNGYDYDDADFAGRSSSSGRAAARSTEDTSSLENRWFVDLDALVEDEDDGEILDMPPVRYYLKGQ